MKRKELKEALSKVAPCAMISFDGEQELPFIALVPCETTPLPADDTAHVRYRNWRIELYTKGYNYALTAAVSEVLDRFGIIWTGDSVYYEEGRCIITYYYFTELEEEE